jgi:subtilisin
VRASIMPVAPSAADPQSLPTGVNRVDAETSSKAAAGPQDWQGLAVAVIDTGSGPHPDLNVAGGVDCTGSGSFNDGNGHGSHVAGTIGAVNNGVGVVGVAPGVPIYSVRVLGPNGAGSTSDVICGINWVTVNAGALGIKVANMSLGGPGQDDGNCGLTNRDPQHLAICRSVGAGVTYVVAAGNGNLLGIPQDLATSVPAAYREVLTVTAEADADGAPGAVGAFDPNAPLGTCSHAGLARERDEFPASFSNFAAPGSAGANHVIAAPGVCIRSTVPTSLAGGTGCSLLQVCDPSGYASISGTSMAAPHIAGTVAVCIASGKCAGPPGDTMLRVRGGAAAVSASFPNYGFLGDPAHAVQGRYYGYLARAGNY